MPRDHRLTHPLLGPVTWSVLKKHAAEHKRLLKKRVCSWCFNEVPKKARTRCGMKECEHRLDELIRWRVCRTRAMRRANYKCQLCDKRADEVDHIIPVSLGGTSDAVNLRALCRDCHKGETTRLKKDRTMYKARTRYPSHVEEKFFSLKAKCVQ